MSTIETKQHNRQTPANANATPASRPGRRSLLIGCLALAIVIVVAFAVVIGIIVGALTSSRVQSLLASLRTATPEQGEADAAEDAHEEDYWTCGMHPWVILPDPGICPICHMDLTPLDPRKLRGEITIDPVVVQNIGVRIAPVTEGPLAQRIRTVGTITYDETQVRDVNTKIGGWIEKLFVDSEGQPVEAGEPLFEIYSPELYQAQEEYLLAWRAQQEGRSTGGIDLMESARTRLEYFDVSEEQVRRLLESDAPTKTLTITSPHSGIVIDKHATEGMRIDPGMRVYQIADVSTVWGMTTIYEHQLPMIEVGQTANMTLPFLPGRTFEGRVVYIYPYLNEQARQASVRLEFENPDGLLKPGMYATIELIFDAREDVVIAPREAVITTGERQVAFVSLGDGRFEPREVKTGLSTGGNVQILEGLQPGEIVVTSGQFLLDSESRMREALAKMVTGEMASEHRPEAEAAQTGEVAILPPEGRAALQSMLAAYLQIGETLAGDMISGIQPKAREIAQTMEALTSSPPASDAHFWHRLDEDVQTVAAQAERLADALSRDLEGAGAIDDARNAYGHLSDALDRIVMATGVPPSLGLAIDRRVCGMAPDVPRAGVWLQPADEDVRNPYFGAMMLRCNMPAEHRRLPMMDESSVPGAESDAPATQPSEPEGQR